MYHSETEHARHCKKEGTTCQSIDTVSNLWNKIVCLMVHYRCFTSFNHCSSLLSHNPLTHYVTGAQRRGFISLCVLGWNFFFHVNREPTEHTNTHEMYNGYLRSQFNPNLSCETSLSITVRNTSHQSFSSFFFCFYFSLMLFSVLLCLPLSVLLPNAFFTGLFRLLSSVSVHTVWMFVNVDKSEIISALSGVLKTLRCKSIQPYTLWYKGQKTKSLNAVEHVIKLTAETLKGTMSPASLMLHVDI